ncbi:MAG: hypothetical protein KC800_18130 [Candidatus Eremiobacteraeota bacterium]|nr:hypothetical protein [Candidatus Eremiobacteraeota bacterium]
MKSQVNPSGTVELVVEEIAFREIRLHLLGRTLLQPLLEKCEVGSDSFDLGIRGLVESGVEKNHPAKAEGQP